ncbi:hypothetical protein DBV15_10564 [Temnothorax longispinosus]|uniref:Uncharacterized protein n=1 Tax=Temnothorax longispinosus TaxID=300112 RepID=A0A4S2L3E1_9HYME|nr:hypothetical protein DBV15_10564 [Temnothorax longispinosus]
MKGLVIRRPMLYRVQSMLWFIAITQRICHDKSQPELTIEIVTALPAQCSDFILIYATDKSAKRVPRFSLLLIDKVMIKSDVVEVTRSILDSICPREQTRLTVMRMSGDAMIKFECRMIDEETNDRFTGPLSTSDFPFLEKRQQIKSIRHQQSVAFVPSRFYDEAIPIILYPLRIFLDRKKCVKKFELFIDSEMTNRSR